jgi:peptidoglycan/xylan/chitin deacetylase (PgdA/CDA1 family)
MVLGVCANERPELVIRAYNEGHTIGSHAIDHAGLHELSEADIREEARTRERADCRADR